MGKTASIFDDLDDVPAFGADHPNAPRDVDVAGLLHDKKEEALMKELESDISRRSLRATKKVWLTKKGKQIPYHHLRLLHLVDILLFIRRKCQKKIEELAAQDGFEPGPDGWRAVEPPEWKGLLAELRSRGTSLPDYDPHGGNISVLADLLDSSRAIPNATMIRGFLKQSGLAKS
jgi:hypothetical protein